MIGIVHKRPLLNALLALPIIACGPAPATQSPRSPSETAPPPGALAATPEPPLVASAAEGEQCGPVSNLEAACEAELVKFDQKCAPVDCEIETLAEAHGVSVLLLTIDDSFCDGECSRTGILGKPLGIPYANECELSTQSHTLALALIRNNEHLWPTVYLESRSMMWSSLQQSLADIEFTDSNNLAWSFYETTKQTEEPDAGDGGETRTSVSVRTFIWLSDRGPRIRYAATLWDRKEDDYRPSRDANESDAEWAQRLSEYRDAKAAQEAARQDVAEVPEISQIPPCGKEHECSPLCVRAK